MERAARFSTRPLIPGSVEWSDDNQVASTTFKVVQLATPRTKSSGQLVIDQTSIPSSVAPKQDPDIVNALQLSPAESLHPVGYWREGFKRSGWSPAGCSALGGCLLATISTHHSVAIWAPIDDPAVGEWEPIQDVNPELRNVAGIYTSAGEIVPEKLATISTMTWSPLHETKGHCPAPLRCSYGTSILSVGTKAGTVVLWRYVEGELKDGFEFKAHKSWVLNLAWSGWRQEVDYEYAYLATSASDGSVRVWSVISRFTESHDEPRQRKVSVQLWAEVEKEDARGMAILSFMHASSEVLPFRLAFTKGRTAGVWLAPQSGLTPHPRSDPLTNSDADFDIALEAHPVVLRCRLPQTMGASAACWDSVGEELTIYTTDGQCFLLALDDDNDPYTFMTPGSSHLSLLRAGLSPSYSSLSLLEDLTATLYRDLIVTSTMEDLIKEATEGKEDGANADEQQSGQEKDGEMSAAELWGKAGKQIRLSGAANSAGGLYHALVYFYAYPDEVNYTTYKSFTSDLLIRPNFTQENNAGGDDELYRLNMDLEDIGEAGLEESLEHKVPRRVKDVIDRNLRMFFSSLYPCAGVFFTHLAPNKCNFGPPISCYGISYRLLLWCFFL
ncbi:hypothetical protein DFS34DRAFT_46885 [Phlyctochytrium arcticum]|nr:hypothetical protein DFS34DRAFT_46885 [Phlyctochytrium arcticum]